MANRKQDWTPRAGRFEDEIDGILVALRNSDQSEAISIGLALQDARDDGQLTRDLAIAILEEHIDLATTLLSDIRKLR